jgi:hypothetical protein
LEASFHSRGYSCGGTRTAPPQKIESDQQSHALDRLRREREPVERLRIGMNNRHACRRREGVADKQGGQNERRAPDDDCPLRLSGHGESQACEEHGRSEETTACADALVEVVADERRERGCLLATSLEGFVTPDARSLLAARRQTASAPASR